MPEIATPPTAPPAPAPTPAPAPAPAPTPAPEPSPAPPSGTPDPAQAQKDRDDVFATLDAKLRLPEPPAKPDATKPESPKAPAPPKEKTVPEFKMPKEFRDNYEKVKSENATFQKQLNELQTKIADYEKRGKDTEALLERAKTLEKKMEEKDSEIRALKQEASPEFKKQYDEPFEERARFAESQIKRLQVIVTPADPENQTAAVTRAATWDDFRALYIMPPNQAIEEAERMFGRASSLVMGHITDLQKMDFARANALAAEKAQFKARQAEEDGKRVQQKAEFDSTYKRVIDELADSVEGYKDSDPTDKELAALRTEGYQIFDAQPANQQQLIVKGAHIRHRVAAYGPNMLTIQRLKKQVSELEAKVQELTPKPPGETRHPGGDNNAPPMEDWAEGLRKVVNAAPAM